MKEKSELQMLIEQERQALNEMVKQFGMLDKRTLEKSQEIDRMVNEYNQLNQE